MRALFIDKYGRFEYMDLPSSVLQPEVARAEAPQLPVTYPPFLVEPYTVITREYDRVGALENGIAVYLERVRPYSYPPPPAPVPRAKPWMPRVPHPLTELDKKLREGQPDEPENPPASHD